MPVLAGKIDPLLAAVLTGGTVKPGIGAGKSLIQDADEVVFHGSFMFHIKIELAVHSL